MSISYTAVATCLKLELQITTSPLPFCSGAGPQFSYTERMQGSNIVVAALMTPLLNALTLIASLAAKLPFLQRLLPKPGQGPSRKVLDSGSFHIDNYAQGRSDDGSSVLVRSHIKVCKHVAATPSTLWPASTSALSGACAAKVQCACKQAHVR